MKNESDCNIIVIGSFGTVIKGLVQRLEDSKIRGQVETVQATSLRSSSFLRRVAETRIPSDIPGVKNSQIIIIIIIIVKIDQKQ